MFIWGLLQCSYGFTPMFIGVHFNAFFRGEGGIYKCCMFNVYRGRFQFEYIMTSISKHNIDLALRYSLKIT